ncbi:11-beta-hydroxysteroid dehydrogenase type 2 isoform X2 [Carettochelys insculpta]|uniref:11-beta-hydroxysteroid dehydrogenase type 2 isoform X2 n=1 Tax=Carettochelys insculpta TaxID=44489 RepID=UPI003EBB58C6
MECWVYGALWGLSAAHLLLQLGRSRPRPASAPALLRLALLALLHCLCQACLPLPLGAPLAAAACLALARLAQPRRLPAAGKAVVVTGCDSGFGKQTAHHLDSLGFKVFASVLDLEGPGAKELRQSCSPRLTLLQMDLTKPDDIQKAQQLILLQTAGTGLWGLVNNAGFNTHLADTELSQLCHFRTCMDVNFFGTLAFTQALLPPLRSSRGRIVTVSSPAGDMPFLCLAAYGASKAALTHLMDTLRNELQPWGVKVSLILPGSFKTGKAFEPAFWHEKKQQLLATLPATLLQAYGEDYIHEANDQFIEFITRANEDLSPVVNCITDALLLASPSARYYPGKGTWLLYFMHHYLPHATRDCVLKKFFISQGLPRALRPCQDGCKQD